MNLPVVVAGKVIGTLNLLAAKGHYTPERVEQSKQLLPYAAIAFLLVQGMGHDAIDRAAS